MAFKDSSIFLKIAPVILSVAALFIVIGLSTNSWVRQSATVEGVSVSQVYGPWKTCVYDKEESCCTSYPQIPDFVKAVRGLTIVGFLVIVAGIVLNALCLFVFDTSMKSMHIATTLLAFVAGSIGAVRAFTILGFLVIAVGIVLSFLCLFAFDMTKKKMHMIAAALAFVSGGFELLGAIIAAAKFPDLLSAVSYSNYMLSWSFGLLLVGALGALAGGAIILVPVIRPQPQGPTVDP